MAAQLQTLESGSNPLDNVEEILAAHNWTFSRMNDDELMVQVAGQGCDYRLFFIWQEDMSALQFCCQYDMTVSEANLPRAGAVLMEINENLWMGHFDIPKDTHVPSFRHTCLLRALNPADSSHQIEDMVDIALAQCERYFSVFHFLCNAAIANDQTLSLALMDTSGEA